MNKDLPASGPVTEEQRDRAVDYLQQAYAKGTLDADQFEDRLSEALLASDRRELNLSLRGIARVAPGASGSALSAAPKAVPEVVDNMANVGSGLVHLLGIPSGFIGPAIVKAASPRGSRLWWEAGRAMAWQFTALLVMVVLVIGGLMFDMEALIPLGWLGWLFTSAVFAVRAFNGSDSTGRLGRAFIFRPELPK